MKGRKNNIKNNHNLRTGRTNTLSRRFYRLSREKSVKSMCYLKIYIKEFLMH